MEAQGCPQHEQALKKGHEAGVGSFAPHALLLTPASFTPFD
jgi:hypothetical protein